MCSGDVKSLFFDHLCQMVGLDVVPFSSARSALLYGMRALELTREDEILIPRFMTHCVLSAISKTVLPVTEPSRRTKAVLVYHQYGYPQRMDCIEAVAKERGWRMINDCANTLLSRYHDRAILDWGDFAVVSVSKIYPCNLGGGIVARNTRVQEWLDDNYERLAELHKVYAERANEDLLKARQELDGVEERMSVDAIFGYLPEVVSFPTQALSHLPSTVRDVELDANRRKQIMNIVHSSFPDRVPCVDECDVVPFAIPVSGDSSFLDRASSKIRESLGLEVPVLHFDYARNMLSPDYKEALVIGCHSEWSKDLIVNICRIIGRL